MIPMKIEVSGKVSELNAFLDTGADISLMDLKFAEDNDIALIKKEHPLTLSVMDGREIQSGLVTHETLPFKCWIKDHMELLKCSIVQSPCFSITLGTDWISKHGPTLNGRDQSVEFVSEYCKENCNQLKLNDQQLIKPELSIKSEEPRISTALINSATFNRLAPNSENYWIIGDIEGDKKTVDQGHIPEKYQSFNEVFDKKRADILPEHRVYDMEINLQPGKTPPWGPIYKTSEPELAAIRDYLQDNLEKGFIRHSQSPAGAPIILAKKKDGSLRFCVDFRGLNQITIKNRYPIPLIDNLFDRFREAKIFTKIDLRGAYNLVRMKEGHEWKTAFRTRYGLFEYRVMPFGLTNAPATFQHLMNDVFREWLDDFVVIYLDDILIYSRNEEDHTEHVCKVLQRLLDNGLYAKLEKCEFDRERIDFLGFTISPKGLEMDQSKVESIQEWKTPASVHDIQVFLGFANFYRRFVNGYSKVISPLTKLLCKGVKFDWSIDCQEAFDRLKLSFCEAPILIHADLNKPFIVETDASGFAIGAILSQKGNDDLLHPVAFYSRKMTPAERNYEIYDKELLAVRVAFEVWRHYLMGAQHQVQVFTDHKNLEYFTTTRKLNGRQMRWWLFFSDFDFAVHYRPGKEQGKPDALSRRSEYQLGAGDGEHDKQHQILLDPKKFIVSAATIQIDDEQPLLREIREAINADTFAQNIIKAIESENVDTDGSNFEYKNDLLYYQGLLYVPGEENQLKILQLCHDSPSAGHGGKAKTYELISRDYWWPRMRDFIRRYVRSCTTCARAKTLRHSPYGLLQPLPVPDKLWTELSMDFIVELPLSEGYDSILVVVDRFSKMTHFIACNKEITAQATAELFMRNIVRIHGLPKSIVSDRGPQFISKFWKGLFALMGTEIKLSTSHHPQTDGQTERVNQALEQYLRCFVNYQQDDWVAHLSTAEFSYNNTVHASTKISPFYANYGYHPRFDFVKPTESHTRVPAAEEKVEQLQGISEILKETLFEAQNTIKLYADRKRKEFPELVIGSKVWLSRKHIKTTRPSGKLDYKQLGPYEVIEEINPVTYRLKLPPEVKIHDVFHVSLLEPVVENDIPNREQCIPSPIIVDGEEEYIVEKIVDSRTHRGRKEYLVEWAGYGPEGRTWEPRANLKNAKDKVTEYLNVKAMKQKVVRRTPHKRGG